ncbi:hypothetical protein FIU84_05715 [Stutzerimonas frequens]|jgi:hypothetical protein|uniref:DUF6285 domain-containing protein n=1 Tax=Stutzerimonas stutzeri TaxID=316 RepID=A0AA42KVX7_STUST|nr:MULTISPECIES: DUF6285 domain-containing protein [Pseudomonadaceae]MAL91234.1 acyl-CoA dehydrogenase [Pseudomonas sp.]MEC7474576.1 DUF6285 domain-containing protein [Pseudomonadota bacterium]MBH3356341.1 hypothetical protein [Stutzerimonas stutzeri]MBH3385878.1 hypothetical protein [Pseudomonas juntendi]MCH2341962.1 DUF6285 domain-containing protein [Pseudomonas sp.]|tara:strand:- start:6812 stop:7171 length:360 start_codon:yes stop_codon:yes gene_type:complete
MSRQPDARELLEVARQTLLQELLPALPSELRYTTLMVANAMAIAARECQACAQAEAQERECLQLLLGEHLPSANAARRALGEAIRTGRYDAPETQGALLDALRQTTVAQLAISNPKALP